MRLLTTGLLVLLAFALAPLSLAAFASLNPGASDALRLLSAVEGTLAQRVRYDAYALSALDGFWRGVVYLALTSASVWLAAYLKPRA